MVRAASPAPLPERPDWWAAEFRFENFAHFRQAARVVPFRTLGTLDAHGPAAAAVFAGLVAQNVRYVEVSFDAERVARLALPFDGVVAAIKDAAPPRLAVRVFGAFSYHKQDRTTPELVTALLDAPGLDGIDLHGDEALRGARTFASAFTEARRRGLAVKAHAGELAGPDSIREALDLLGVDRIEHGVRAIEDERLLTRLAADAITLDVCPWSNVKMGVARDLTSHPIRRLHDRGIRVTVSTDDPTIFGRTLTEELAAVVDDAGFARAELLRLQANAFEVALITPQERATALAGLSALRAR